MAIQSAAAQWRVTCSLRRSWCGRQVRANLFLVSAYLGLIGGLALGTLEGILVGIGFRLGGPEAVFFAAVTGALVGAIAGVTVGIANGIMLTLLSRTPVLRCGAGVSRNRVAVAAVISTFLGSVAVLHSVLKSPFGYLPVIAATLLAAPLSRKLPLR